MRHDRVGGDRFHLTQEFIADMLGVHWPSVSLVTSAFQQAGLIRYSRGDVQILDRCGLEDACCACYAFVSQQFDRLLGLPARPVPVRPGQAPAAPRRFGGQADTKMCEARADGSGSHRTADQVIEGTQRCLGAIAGGNDDLLERHRGGVARCKHARHRRLAA